MITRDQQSAIKNGRPSTTADGQRVWVWDENLASGLNRREQESNKNSDDAYIND